jgi:hypothetical protein
MASHQNRGFSDRSPFQRVLLIVMAPVAFLATVLGISLILVPVAMWNGVVLLFCWIRFRLFGTPIPPKGPPQQLNPK